MTRVTDPRSGDSFPVVAVFVGALVLVLGGAQSLRRRRTAR